MPPSAVRGDRPVQTSSQMTPQVESYDEETYVCQGGDTFENISAQFYHTEKLGPALLLFNRSHPRAAAALWKDGPTLQEGMPVYIPPVRILEKNHAAAIPDFKPTPAPGLGAGPAAPMAASTPDAPPATARGGPQYAVRKVEMISAIARDTLGNWQRWTEIYKLNGHINPSQPLMVGTVLAMPADAVIPPENKP
jgi:nucleoid-associated protein YgaU